MGPLESIIDQISHHFLEVLLLTPKANALRRIDIDGDCSLVMDLLHRAGKRRQHRAYISNIADDCDTRRKPRALKMARHLVAHDLGLLANLEGERDHRHDWWLR